MEDEKELFLFTITVKDGNILRFALPCYISNNHIQYIEKKYGTILSIYRCVNENTLSVIYLNFE